MGKRKAEYDGIEDLKRQLRAARSKGNFREVAALYNSLGHQYRNLGHFEDALEQHREEIQISKIHNKKDRMGLGIAFRNMAEVLIDLKKPKEATAYVKQYLQIAKEVGNYVEMQRANITYGRTYGLMAIDENLSKDERLELLIKGYNYFRNAYMLLKEDDLRAQITDEKEYMMMKSNNCQHIGINFEGREKFPEAIVWLKRAIDYGDNKSYKLHEYLGSSYLILSQIYFKQGKWSDALAASKNATESYKALGNLNDEIESLIQQAKGYFALNDVEEGKKILKKLRRRIQKKKDLHEYYEEIDPLLTAAVKICQDLDTMFMISENNWQQRMKLHEKLGDNYTALHNYLKAIEHYKKACECAEKLGITGKKLGRLYFSIGESYKDLNEFSVAYEYYLKEMEVFQGNDQEEFRTQTNICNILEKLEKSPEDVIAAHQAAIVLAKRTKSLSKLYTAINNFGLYLRTIGKTEEAEKQLRKADKIKSENDVEEEEDPDSQEILDDDEVDLDNLSADEESDDEMEEEGKRRPRRIGLKKNEAGESPLHIAAKKGDLKLVIRLIREGHPVRDKDYAGWAPLHEAANYGHARVVDELLKNGAQVNEYGGGSIADKITPLHDAAGNCHCEVMRVLLKHGANVLAKDAHNRYPIDHLISWRESEFGQKASEDVVEAYREMKEILKEKMAQAGKVYGKEHERKARRIRSRNKSPEMSLLINKDQDYDDPIPVTITTDNFDPDNEGDGTKLYMNTMKQMRRREGEGPKSKGRPREISPGPQNALIMEFQDVHNGNDWLLPDDTITTKENEVVKIGQTTSKRKRDSLESLDDALRNGGSGGSGRRQRGSKSRRKSRIESPTPSPSRDLEDMELDAESNHSDGGHSATSNSSRRSRSESGLHSRRNSEVMGDPMVEDYDVLNDDILNSILDAPDDDPVISLDLDEDFLPSQRPRNTPIEFGKTVDVPIVERGSEDSDGGRDSPVLFRRSKKSQEGATRRSSTVQDSTSDEDEDFQPRRRNRQSMSDVASVLKRATGAGNNANSSGRTGNSSSKNMRSLTQTRLPIYATKNKPTGTNRNRKSDADLGYSRDSSPEVVNVSETRGIRRTSSSHSLTSRVSNGGGGGASGVTATGRTKKEVWRLKIKVVGIGIEETLLVPVEECHQNENIAWLASQCATRYLSQHGIKPILTLKTKDGATLSATDSMILALGETERELDATVTGFEQPPLVDRYCEACGEESLVPDPEVKSCLNICQSSNVLDLIDSNLRGKNGCVLFKALQRQSSLRVMILSGCSLFDKGLMELCKIVPTLSNLMELDLSSNGITGNGLTIFAEVFHPNNQSNLNDIAKNFGINVPIGLTSLKLNHNPLGNSAGRALISLLERLNSLKCLELMDCNFSEKLFSWSGNDLTRAFNNSRLEEFDISYNNLKTIGLEKILQCLPARKLKSLKCSSCSLTSGDSSAEVIARSICSLLTQNEDCCNLKTLQLNDSGLNDKAMSLILDNFDRLVRLENLEVMLNDGLTSASLTNILNRCVESSLPLTRLDLSSIPNLWNNPEVAEGMIKLAIENKMSSDKKLVFLKLPSSTVDPNTLNNVISQIEKNDLSALETRVISLMEDFAGNMQFHYEKLGSSITYRFED